MKNKLKKLLLFSFVGVLPLQITTTSNDSTETNFRVAGGFGQYAYVSRGCEGDVLDKEKIPFSEIGVSIDHKTKTPLRLGINASYILTQKERDLESYYEYTYYSEKYAGNKRSMEIFTVNPFMNAEWKNFALGVGYFGASRSILHKNDGSREPSFSGYLRIGNIRSTYFDMSLFHATTIYSEGYFKLGIGYRPNPALGWWFGLGRRPYDKFGFIVKTDIRLRRYLSLDALVHLGSSEGISECAASCGLTYKLTSGK
jgi:hypothetical protein